MMHLLICLSFCAGLGLSFQNIISKTRTSVIHRYETYKDVTLIHLHIPQQTLFASFKFTGDETRMSIFPCSPKNVTLYLKFGAPPVVNPDETKYPKDFKNITRSMQHHIEFETDKKEHYINLTSPHPGSYYTAVFLSFVDPKYNAITQQGLSPSCYSNVEASVYVEKIQHPLIVAENTLIEIISAANVSRYYKTYISDECDHAFIQVETVLFSPNVDSLNIRVDIEKPPSSHSYIATKRFFKNSTEKVLYFWTTPGSWHFIEIIFESKEEKYVVRSKATFRVKTFTNVVEDPDEYAFLSNETFFNNSITKLYRNSSIVIPYKQYDLVRDDLSETFTYSFVLGSELKFNKIMPINMSDQHFSTLQFTIRDGTDIGGTLQFIMAFKPRIKRNEMTIGFESEPKKNIIIACLSRELMEIPVWPNKCVTSYSERLSQLILNSTVENATILVPYPEIGTWYVTFKLFCQDCIPCSCPEDCQNIYNSCVEDCEINCDILCQNCTQNCRKILFETNDCKYCDCDGPCLRSDTQGCNSSIIFDVSSRPCVSGKCAPNGACHFMVSDGVVFSTCHCQNKYRGWDCSDDSFATPYCLVVIELLLLVLSNLAFLPAVYVAFKRKYYIESITYFSICFFSTFYHSCDAGENLISYCLTRLDALQFGDFFCAILAIWVTLIAIADLSQLWTSIAHMVGAISLAFCTSIDRMALWVFVLPVVVGIGIISVSWYFKYRKVEQWFINKRYSFVKLPVGGGVVTMGLIMFAFLETEDNYKYIHSLWHIFVAFSITMVLPDRNTFLPEVLI